jgi:hypothetical protein
MSVIVLVMVAFGVGMVLGAAISAAAYQIHSPRTQRAREIDAGYSEEAQSFALKHGITRHEALMVLRNKRLLTAMTDRRPSDGP